MKVYLARISLLRLSHDQFFQKVVAFLPYQECIPSIVLPDIYDDMMRYVYSKSPEDYASLFNLMVLFQIEHVYNGFLIVRESAKGVGKGLFVADGHTCPEGFILGLWGAIGYKDCLDLKSLHRSRQIEVTRDQHIPQGVRFLIHDACIGGFVNNVGGRLSSTPNCKLWYNDLHREKGRWKWDSDSFIVTTSLIQAGEEFLFSYEGPNN